MHLILGSGSRYRQQILRDMGFEFEVRSPDLDEKAIRRDNPEDLTLAIAQAKAAALLPGARPGDILLTVDEVVIQAGRIMEKPRNEAEARHFLETAADAPIETVLSVVATDVSSGRRVEGHDRVRIVLRPLPPETINQLLAEPDTYICAGGFRFEHPLIGPLVVSMDGEIESVMGLSPKLVRRLLGELGYPGI
jgi:septum formation protein